jgi:hypothetical protein
VRVRSYGALAFVLALAERGPAAGLKELRTPHFGQLTREIWPRLVMVATMWPRSS